MNRETSLPEGLVWRQIEVSGEHDTEVNFVDGSSEECVQVIDSTARSKILENFKKLKAVEGFEGVPVDKDHLSRDKKNETKAMAWLHDMREKNGHLYGLLDITNSGRRAVEGRDYKFTSTEYDPDTLEWLAEDRFRPTQLVGLAFTNQPNNKGGRSLSSPISNRAPAGSGSNNQPNQKTTMQSIAKKLGLDPEATEEEILAAIENLQTENEDHKSKEEEAEVEDILNRNSDRIPEESREKFKALLITNREDGEEIIKSLPESKGEKPGSSKRRETITNRRNAKQPGGGISGQGDEKKLERRATLISNRASRYKKEMGLTAAYQRAEEEIDAEEENG